jgi:hypothetical protein
MRLFEPLRMKSYRFIRLDDEFDLGIEGTEVDEDSND